MTTFIVALVCWLLNRRRKSRVDGTGSVGNVNLYADHLYDVGSDATQEREVILVSLDRWVRSDNESRWHILESGGFEPVALCEHVLRIRHSVYSILSRQPLYIDGCSVCPNCYHLAAEIEQQGQIPTQRSMMLEQALTTREPAIYWPERDPDEEGVPGSAYLPGTDPEAIAWSGRHARAA